MCASTHIGVHVQRNTVNRTPSLLPPHLPLSSSHSLCFSYITARCPRPNLHFSPFASLSLSPSLSLIFFFLFPSSFLPSPLPCFSTFFCSSGKGRREGGGGESPKHERRQNVNGGACVEAHTAAVALAPPSVSCCSHADVFLR